MKHSDPLERATQPRDLGETWDDDKFKENREQDLRQRTADVRSAVMAAVSCLLLATLLTSAKIVEIAERQEFGAARDRQLAVAEQIDRVANFFSLNRPYDLIHDLRGIGDDAASRIDTIDEVVADLGLEVEEPTPLDLGPAEGEDGPTATTPADEIPTTTTTESVEPIRTVSADRPLTVFVGGDSQAEYLAQAITTESDLSLVVKEQYEISTSLSRPDYFNWPARLSEIDTEQNPEAVVFFIGANDHQDMTDSADNRLVEGSPEWQVEWQRRLGITFDLLERDGRQIFWVTQPPMRDGELNAGIDLINALAKVVIADRSFVTAIDIWPLLGGERGFSERVVGPDGAEIRARIDDGVHLTRDAASWVADMVFAAFANTWDFE